MSFNSTKRRVESFIVSYIRYRFVTACNKMLFRCLWRNVETSCHKSFAVLSRHQQTLLLTTSEVSQLAWRGPTASYWQHLAGSSVNSSEARYLLRIAISAYLTYIRCPVRGGSRRNIVVPFGTEKTRMVWLPDGEKNLKISLLILRECTNVTDTQTDRQTPHDGIGRAYA